jgi:hypothetical protein
MEGNQQFPDWWASNRRACERFRSKPIWTLAYPENRPCGYAVDMLRTTIPETLLSKRRGLMSAPLSSKSAPVHTSRFSGNGINGQASHYRWRRLAGDRECPAARRSNFGSQLFSSMGCAKSRHRLRSRLRRVEQARRSFLVAPTQHRLMRYLYRNAPFKPQGAADLPRLIGRRLFQLLCVPCHF